MIRDLHRRRGRERRGLVLLEGVRLVEEAIATGIPLRGAVTSTALEGTPRGRALKEALYARAERLEEVDEPALGGLAATEHPQGVVVVAEPPPWDLARIPIHRATTLLVLDAVQDPGNVGAMVRTAAGLGASGVLALPGTAEFTNPKALRGTMGAFFRLPCVALAAPDLRAWLEANRIEVWLAEAGGEPLRGRAGAGPLAIVVGNEGAGAGPAAEAMATTRVAIPLAAGVESLNVAVAAGILLWEVMDGG